MSDSNMEVVPLAPGPARVTLGHVFLEYLSHRALWPFLGMFLSSAAFLVHAGLSARDAMWFFIGAAFFVPQEYLTHAFILHMPLPKREWPYFWAYRMHYGHHDMPKRHDLMYMPLWLTLPLTLANVALLWLIGRELRPFLALFCGTLAGYIVFEWVHLLCHVPYAIKCKLGQAMRRRHMLHHYYDEKRWLAVTAFMDLVAGTAGARERSAPTANARLLGLHPDHEWLGKARARFAARSSGNLGCSRLWLRPEPGRGTGEGSGGGLGWPSRGDSAMSRYARWLLRRRGWVIAATVLATLVLGSFAANLKIVIDPVTMAPQDHPLVQSTNRIDRMFGSKYLVLVGVTPRQGDIFQPAVLERIQRMTNRIEATPGVVRSSLVSLAARQAKGIRGTADSFEARPLLGKMPSSEADKAALRSALLANPVYMKTIVSPDFRTAAILFEMKERTDGFQKLVAPVYGIVKAEQGPDVDIALSGSPVYMEKTEKFAERINWLFPIALLVIGWLHYEAFRTIQGMILPLVTALMAVCWGLGFMGMLGQPLDIFNSPTPILILAVAAGHAVQLLKRYYEEYEGLRKTGTLGPAEANRAAVVQSLAGVGPVMMIAGGVAALGFFSLVVFKITTIRTFGIFTGIGILSAVVLEMTFIPAVRSLLKPPADRDRASGARPRIWDRIPRWIGDQVVPAGRRRWMMVGFAVFAALCLAGMDRIRINSDSKSFFARSLDFQKDDDYLNSRLGGANGLYVMVEGAGTDAIKSPDVLKAIESTQRYAETLPQVGKTVSIVDFLRRMNQAMHGDSAAQDRLAASRELNSQYLLLYSVSGDPTDFDAYVDTDYRTAKISILLKTGSSAEVYPVMEKIREHAAHVFGPGVRVSFGGEVAQTVALSETLIHGKVLNIVQIALAIFVISALAFRSLVAGLIVLMPLAMAVLAVFGVMGAFGIPLNVPNSLISAMAVGIGADYAIYLLYRMRERARMGDNQDDAVRQALATAGKAALFVATAVAGGYGVLALSIGYNVHLWLSLFIVVAMVVSVWASLTLVPALVLYLKPGFIFGTAVARPDRARVALLLAGAGLLLTGQDARAEAPAPLAIMQKNLAATKVKDSVASATFTLTGNDGATRVRKTSGFTRLQSNGDDNMRLVRFLSPADIKGTATLLLEHAGTDDDMWIYLPALGKVRRLSASNKKDSFVGTDLSYGDVIGYKPQEWRHRLVREEEAAGAPCYVIESLPANETVAQNSGYGKRVSWVRKDNFVAPRIEITDTAGRPLKRILAADIRQVGSAGRWQAMRTEAENLQTGHKTLIQLDRFEADQNVPESLFTAKELEK